MIYVIDAKNRRDYAGYLKYLWETDKTAHASRHMEISSQIHASSRALDLICFDEDQNFIGGARVTPTYHPDFEMAGQTMLKETGDASRAMYRTCRRTWVTSHFYAKHSVWCDRSHVPARHEIFSAILQIVEERGGEELTFTCDADILPAITKLPWVLRIEPIEGDGAEESRCNITLALNFAVVACVSAAFGMERAVIREAAAELIPLPLAMHSPDCSLVPFITK